MARPQHAAQRPHPSPLIVGSAPLPAIEPIFDEAEFDRLQDRFELERARLPAKRRPKMQMDD